MRLRNRKIRIFSFLFLILILSSLFCIMPAHTQQPEPQPQPEPEPEPEPKIRSNHSGISLHSSNISDVRIECDSYVFYVSKGRHQIEVRTYVETTKTLSSLDQFIRDTKTNCVIIMERKDDKIHYGYNLTAIPISTANTVQKIYFSLRTTADSIFPQKYLSAVKRYSCNETTTLSVFDIYFSFEDLKERYSPSFTNSSCVAISGVTSKTNIDLDPIIFGGTYIEDSNTNDIYSYDEWLTLYNADVDGSYDLLGATDNFIAMSMDYINATYSIYTMETDQANNSTTNDMTLVPINGVSDCYYIGHNTSKFEGVTFNVTTAGAGTYSLAIDQWRKSGGFYGWYSPYGLNNGLNHFKTAGMRNATWTLSQTYDWAKKSVNGISAYWIRVRVSSFTSVTTNPLGRRAWVRWSLENQPVVYTTGWVIIRFNVTSYLSDGFAIVKGNGFSGTLENDVTINGTGTFSTVDYFNEVAQRGIFLSGKMTVAVIQIGWNVIDRVLTNEAGQYSYFFYCGLRIGNGTSLTTFAWLFPDNVVFTSYAYQPVYSGIISVLNNATLYVGYSTDTFGTDNYFLISQTITNDILYSQPNGTIYLYEIVIYSSGLGIQCEGNLTMRGCMLATYSGGLPYLTGDKLDISYCTIDGWSIGGYDHTTGNISHITIVRGSLFDVLLYADACENANYSNFVCSSSHLLQIAQEDNSIDINLTDFSVSGWNYFWSDDIYFPPNSGEVYLRFTFSLAVTYPNGSLVEDADVAITQYGQGKSEIGTFQTDSDGEIQTMLYAGFFNKTYPEYWDYNPYQLNITKGSYSYIGNFTLANNHPTTFSIAIEKSGISDGVSKGWELGEAVVAVLIFALILIVVIIAVLIRRR